MHVRIPELDNEGIVRLYGDLNFKFSSIGRRVRIRRGKLRGKTGVIIHDVPSFQKDSEPFIGVRLDCKCCERRILCITNKRKCEVDKYGVFKFAHIMNELQFI